MGRNAELNAGANSPDAQSVDFMSTHPATPERIKNAQVNARQYSAPGAGERDKAAYLAAVDGLVFGDDPADGFTRGRRFTYPRLGFTFLVPEDFTIDNSAQSVLAVKEGAKTQLRIVDALQLAEKIGFPSWVEVDVKKLVGTFKGAPERSEFGQDINESLVVELYSK